MVADVRAKAGGHGSAPGGELGVHAEGGVGRLGPDGGSEKCLGAELDVLQSNSDQTDETDSCHTDGTSEEKQRELSVIF